MKKSLFLIFLSFSSQVFAYKITSIVAKDYYTGEIGKLANNNFQLDMYFEQNLPSSNFKVRFYLGTNTCSESVSYYDYWYQYNGGSQCYRSGENSKKMECSSLDPIIEDPVAMNSTSGNSMDRPPLLLSADQRTYQISARPLLYSNGSYILDPNSPCFGGSFLYKEKNSTNVQVRFAKGLSIQRVKPSGLAMSGFTKGQAANITRMDALVSSRYVNLVAGQEYEVTLRCAAYRIEVKHFIAPLASSSTAIVLCP